MTDKEFNEQLAKIVYLGDNDTKVAQIRTLIKQNYVRLSDDQSLPPTPVPVSTVTPISLTRWYRAAQQDMLKPVEKDGKLYAFRKVEIER